MTLRKSGEFIQEGDTILTIVPPVSALLAQVRISPKDIGFVKTGQSTLIRVDGYRFGRVGGVKGSIDRISADAVTNENRENYFQAWVKRDKNYVGEDPAANRVITGMTVIADIEIGSKSLMSYLLRPIKSSLNNAFSER